MKIIKKNDEITFSKGLGGFTIKLGEKPKPPSTENQSSLKEWFKNLEKV